MRDDVDEFPHASEATLHLCYGGIKHAKGKARGHAPGELSSSIGAWWSWLPVGSIVERKVALITKLVQPKVPRERLNGNNNQCLK